MPPSKPLRNAVLLFGFAGMLSHGGSGQAIHVNRRQIVAQPLTPVNSLSVSVSPSFVSFALVSKGIATGSSAVQVTTSWDPGFCTPTCTVNLYGYFSSAASALTAGAGANIPSSAVLGQVPTGTPTTYTAFTQTGALGGAGASLLLFNQMIRGHARKMNRRDALNLEIDLTGQALPAGNYTGTLYIQAQTF
jgi:hypothetical protein